MTVESTVDVCAEMRVLLDAQAGGILATVGADASPHQVFVLTATNDALEIIFASLPHRQHSQDIGVNPRVAFLIDNRGQMDITVTPALFQRLEVSGTAAVVAPDDGDYPALAEALLAKHGMVRRWLEGGAILCRIRPERLTLNIGGSERHEHRPGAASAEVGG